MRKIVLFCLLSVFMFSGSATARERQDRDCRDHGKKERFDRRHSPSYFVVDNKVFYKGRELQDASALTFTVLPDGYAKDAWSVYYRGAKMKDTSATTFKVLGDGYAGDAWNVYYRGAKIKDATATTFKVLGEGYAKDAWNVYYRGKKAGD